MPRNENWGLPFALFVLGVCIGLIIGRGIHPDPATPVETTPEERAAWQTVIASATPYAFTPTPVGTSQPDGRTVDFGPPEPSDYVEGYLVLNSKTFRTPGKYLILRIGLDKRAEIERYDVPNRGSFTIFTKQEEFLWVWRFDDFSADDENEWEVIKIALGYSYLKEIQMPSGVRITRP